MGIKHFSDFSKRLDIKTDTLVEVKDKCQNMQPVNVYIDGSMTIFYGCVKDSFDTVEEDSRYNEKRVAQTSFLVFKSKIEELQRMLNINKIIFLIDGVRPTMKKYTSQKRKSKNMYDYSPYVAMTVLTGLLLDNFKNLEIKHLILGEAEHECAIRRDVNRPSFILSGDSDLFNITYKYHQQTEQDLIFISNKSFTAIYDMSTIDLKVPKLVLNTLLMLKGSDFTDNIFTDTMCVAFINTYSSAIAHRSFINKQIISLNNIASKYENLEKEIQIKNATNENYKYITFNNVMEANKYELCSQLEHETINAIYEINDIYYIIYKILLILIYIKHNGCLRFTWNRTNDIKKNAVNILDKYNSFEEKTTRLAVEAITWGVNYTLIGSRCCQYFSRDCYFQLISQPFNFYLSILDSCKYNNLKNNILKTRVSRAINVFDFMHETKRYI